MRPMPPIKWMGMPWHGLADGGVLTTPLDGNKMVAGDGGAVTVRHPSALGAVRNLAQQTKDAAYGHEWRDYALLCGTMRAVDGGPALGANRWLYCAPDGRTWVMSVEKAVSGATFTLEIWRRGLFGAFRIGGVPHTIADQKVGQLDILFVLPGDYSGGETANSVAASAYLDRASCVVPNPAGSSVFVHVMADKDVFHATKISIEGDDAGTYAIVPVTISGSGDVNANGIGISANFGTVDRYEDLVDEDNGSFGGPSSQPSDWTDCQNFSDPPPPTDPQSAGLQYDQRFWTIWDFMGVQIGRNGPINNAVATVYRTHHGDVKLTKRKTTWSYRHWERAGNSWEQTLEYQSEQTGEFPPGTPIYSYVLQNTSYNCDVYEVIKGAGAGSATGGEWEVRIEYEAFNIGERLANRQNYDFTPTYPAGGGTGCNQGWPHDGLPSPYSDNLDESSIGPLTNGMTHAAVDLDGGLTVYPGLLLLTFWYNKPDNSDTRRYRQVGLGIGESDVIKFMDETLELPTGVWPPPQNDIQNRWSFQPVQEVGSFDSTPFTVSPLQYC